MGTLTIVPTGEPDEVREFELDRPRERRTESRCNRAS